MNTQSSKVEVLWSPNKEEEFATYGTDLRLYKHQRTCGFNGGAQKVAGAAVGRSDLNLDEDCAGYRIGTLNSDIHCMPVHMSVAWQQNEKRPHYFAIGQSSGKAVLANLGLDQTSSTSTTNQILIPHNGRPCLCLSWNPSETNLLAEGQEKSRNESSLTVWDVTRASTYIHTPSSSEHSRATKPQRSVVAGGGGETYSGASDSARHFEVGMNEATFSLAWLPNQSHCLLAGMGSKFLRLYDVRERSEGHGPSSSSVHPREVAIFHKAISGVCIDPLSPQTFATYTEGGACVYVWDLRQFARPAYSFTRNGNILRLSWMPTRPGRLGIILSEAPYLRIIDLPSYTDSQDQMDLFDLYTEHFTQRLTDRCPYINRGQGYSKLTGMSWHHKWENICLLATTEGGVKKLNVCDKIPLSWSPHQDLLFSSSYTLCVGSEETRREGIEEDISIKMKRRVKDGYGFDTESNSKLLQSDDVQLYEVWEWLKLNKMLMSKGVLPVDKTHKTMHGVCSILGTDKHNHDAANNSFFSKRSSWHDQSTTPSTELPPFPTFSSSERTTSLQLCGWSFCGDSTHTLESFLKCEELNDRYERAAAIAVFQGNIRRGIAALKNGASVALKAKATAKSMELNLIALALSGYSPHEKLLWHDTCTGIKAQISQPYLKAAFIFLSGSGSGRDGFADVLGCDISLQDRVAFACIYLDDTKLLTYVRMLTADVVDKGLILGLFLTGLSDSGIKLLTNYVNEVGDIQTASLMAGQVMSFAIKYKEVQAWFQGYRDLLDIWKFWHERALFDGEKKKLDPLFKPPRQAFVMCGYCSKSITSESLRHDRRLAYKNASDQRAPTSCPNCRKPLPRCSLCLLNMVARQEHSSPLPMGLKVAPSQFGQWFTWCQCCHHGGHAHHIAEWFSHHNECPVSGCVCNCFSLDSSL